MTDISKCSGDGCQVKDNCYRFTAPSDPYRQSFILPQCDDDGLNCKNYWLCSDRFSNDPIPDEDDGDHEV